MNSIISKNDNTLKVAMIVEVQRVLDEVGEANHAVMG
jgi:hypothetical protein